MQPDVLLPVADLSEQDERPWVVYGRLVGTTCLECGTVMFPTRFACLGCGHSSLADVYLKSTGTLYSFATVHVSTSRPTPYTIGYVDLDDGVRILSTIGGDPSRLVPGGRVRLEPTATDYVTFIPETKETRR